jgi:hypothetical protein
VHGAAPQADVVIGYGGGKTIDAAKGIAKAHNLRLFIVPTIASNDSPTSRLIVLYDDQHRVTRVDRLTRNPDVVLVDTAIIARAPARFFAAGLGDALSKKFEATQCHLAEGKNFFGTESLATARLLAERCYDTIIEFGLPALKQIQDHGTPNESVERAVEASVLLSGLKRVKVFYQVPTLRSPSLPAPKVEGFNCLPAPSTAIRCWSAFKERLCDAPLKVAKKTAGGLLDRAGYPSFDLRILRGDASEDAF